MKAPEEIYVNPTHHGWYETNEDNNKIPYIRKDISDKAIKSAKKEFRKKMLKWAKEQLEYYEKILKNYPTEREYIAFVGAYQNMIDTFKL